MHGVTKVRSWPREICALGRTVAVAAALTALAGCAGQQAGPGERPLAQSPPQRPSISEIIVKLDLTDEQRPVVREILESAEERREALVASRAQGDRPDPSTFQSMRSEAERVASETEAQLEAILTDEQMDAYRACLEELRPTFDERAGRWDARSETSPGGGSGRGW